MSTRLLPLVLGFIIGAALGYAYLKPSSLQGSITWHTSCAEKAKLDAAIEPIGFYLLKTCKTRSGQLKVIRLGQCAVSPSSYFYQITVVCDKEDDANDSK